MVMMDDVTLWNWKFGFGTKDATGRWQPDLELAFIPTPNSWGKGLNAPPWNVSPQPMPQMYMPDHFARVTREWALNALGPVVVDETPTHLVTN